MAFNKICSVLAALAVAMLASGFEASFDNEAWQQERLAMMSRTIDTYQVTRYIPNVENKTIKDCDRNLRNKYQVQFAALRANDGSEYYGHIVASSDAACFNTSFNTTANMNLKTCLEAADSQAAVAFNFDQATGTCTMYKSNCGTNSCAWRQHKFRQCKRGTDEKMYYLQRDRPSNYNACSNIKMAQTAKYTGTGSVTVTVTFSDHPCCCDIDRIAYSYLSVNVDLSLTTGIYQYTYPTNQFEAWLNTTRIEAWAENQIVVSVNNYIPGNDL